MMLSSAVHLAFGFRESKIIGAVGSEYIEEMFVLIIQYTFIEWCSYLGLNLIIMSNFVVYICLALDRLGKQRDSFLLEDQVSYDHAIGILDYMSFI